MTETFNDYRIAQGLTFAHCINLDYPGSGFEFSADHVPFNAGVEYKFVVCGVANSYDPYASGYPVAKTDFELGFESFDLNISSTSASGDVIYSRYTWVSSAFSFSEIWWHYSDLELGTNPLNKDFYPHTMWDDDLLEANNGLGILNQGVTPDEMAERVSHREWSENFTSDYGVGSFTDIFKGSSNVFKFITASLSVLPSWFMTILTSFFVALLAVIFLKLFL